MNEWSKTLGEAITAAASVAAFHPPPANELANAQVRVVAIKRALAAEAAVANSALGEALSDFLRWMEAGTRQQIHDKSRKVVSEISTDVQRMWGILHPSDPIADIRLHIPDDADKAIDIALQFHGKALESPRLTLSEGYRNSLHQNDLITTTTFQDLQAGGKMIIGSLTGLNLINNKIKDGLTS